MGQEIDCKVRIGRKSAAGKALLESSELVFRSDALRLRIPFARITRLDAPDGVLTVTHDGDEAVFEIGPRAAAWAEKIRNPKSLLDKLGVKPTHRVAVVAVLDESFLAQLRQRAPNTSLRLRKDCDAVFVGADSLGDLHGRLPKARAAIKRDGMVWTVTPKGKGGIRDVEVMAAGKAVGLVDVKVAAFSATHSALKFVIPKALR